MSAVLSCCGCGIHSLDKKSTTRIYDTDAEDVYIYIRVKLKPFVTRLPLAIKKES